MITDIDIDRYNRDVGRYNKEVERTLDKNTEFDIKIRDEYIRLCREHNKIVDRIREERLNDD